MPTAPLRLGSLCWLFLSLSACGDKDDIGPAELPPEGSEPGECDDGADNDQDGAYDCEDSDCEAAPDCEEAENTAPEVSTVSLSPTDAATGDTLTASVTATDADGDTLSESFSWLVDGVEVQTGAASTLDGASFFDKGQTVRVTATVHDGTATASADSDELVIANTPPGAPEVSVPDEAIAGEDLVCTLVTESEDADGDELSYAFTWAVDGADHSSSTTTTHAGDTVAGEDLGPDEEWTCTVTPSDDESEGTAASASVVTSAAPPEDCDSAEYGDGTYWFCTPTLSWEDAHAHCTEASLDLVSIASAEENEFIAETAASLGLNGSGVYLWTGLHDQSEEGTFEWTDGTTFDYSTWNYQQPDGGGNQNCGVMNMDEDDGYGEGYWHDSSCSYTYAFVCEDSG